MLKAIYSTITGKYAAEKRLDFVSNNIANSLTPGFKASRPMTKVVKEETRSPLDNQPTISYVHTLDSYVNFSDAPMVESGSPLDFAIEGEGFFVISTPKGERYTRNGQFTLDREKRLVTMDGSRVMGKGGEEIIIDGQEISVETDGTIYVDKISAGTLRVVDFKDKTSLRNFGKSLFINTDNGNQEITAENFSVKQGAYETSNVDVMTELVELISTLRAYESYSKVDQFFSDMMSRLMEVGRV
jgi:flagellar basal-body rod protein FlgF